MLFERVIGVVLCGYMKEDCTRLPDRGTCRKVVYRAVYETRDLIEWVWGGPGWKLRIREVEFIKIPIN
jgi:hypothetical protein